MTRAPRHPDRQTVADLVEELRDEAQDIAPDLHGISPQETVYGESAQTLEEFETALTQIADGAADPKAVAAAALSLSKPLKPLGSAGEAIRTLLKPRRT